MSVEWSYAQLSKMASSVGGPEKLLKIVITFAIKERKAQGGGKSWTQEAGDAAISS